MLKNSASVSSIPMIPQSRRMLHIWRSLRWESIQRQNLSCIVRNKQNNVSKCIEKLLLVLNYVVEKYRRVSRAFCEGSWWDFVECTQWSSEFVIVWNIYQVDSSWGTDRLLIFQHKTVGPSPQVCVKNQFIKSKAWARCVIKVLSAQPSDS